MSRVDLTLPEKFLFSTEMVVRASDLNYGNHIGHDRILSLMQDARVEFYRSIGFKNELNFEGSIGQVISDVIVQYKSESFLGDVLVMHIAVTDFNKYGFDMYYKVENKASGKEVARAKIGIVCLDYATRKIARIPEILKNRLEGY
jgi:YbgC/YbaW family acyl-CoA thioester hydrolase